MNSEEQNDRRSERLSRQICDKRETWRLVPARSVSVGGPLGELCDSGVRPRRKQWRRCEEQFKGMKRYTGGKEQVARRRQQGRRGAITTGQLSNDFPTNCTAALVNFKMIDT